jgi:hypothetical protein
MWTLFEETPTGFDITKTPWWVIAIIVVVIMIIVLVVPAKFWKKIGSKKNNKNAPLAIEVAPSNDSSTTINRASEFELARPKTIKEKKLLGIYNGAGHKSSMRLKQFVYVYPEHDTCDLCRPFEGKIISLEKKDDNVPTMSEAIAQGYHHIGCKHVDVDYYSNETEIPTSPWNEKEQTSFHKKVLKLFRMENDLRVLTFNINEGISTNVSNDQLKINHLKEEIEKHCSKNNLTYTERRFSPYITDGEKFNYLPVEKEGNK